jgi:molybdate transport system ATP-binding protein
MTLSVAVRRRLGSFNLDAAFESEGHLTVLFGPSGSGKTSVVNLIAGLARPDSGRIAVDGRVLVDTEARIFLPKHRRRIGYVFQDARLFPHLTVRQNLGYGRFFSPKAERRENFTHVVDLLGIGHLLDRRPSLLSGGEKQRVAIGRALLSSPKLLLMDEPLAALDEARKAEIMPYLERLRDETKVPIVYVSHSIAEVARLATTIVVMADGSVAASGPARDIVGRLDLMPPEERREAGAVLDMVVAEQDRHFGMTVLRSAAGDIHVPGLNHAVGSLHRVRIPARDVILAVERPIGLSALNILSGTIAAIAPAGDNLIEIRLDCHGEMIISRITRRSLETLGLVVGRNVFAVVKAVAFDEGTVSREKRIET